MHGYRQDGQFFKEKLGGFRKNVKNFAELVFIDAPHIIPNDKEEGDVCPRSGRGWWFATEDDTFHALYPTEIAKGFDVTMETIVKCFQTQGPFHGILGFSQGAALAALICGLKEFGEIQENFQFVILIAGFKSSSKCHDYLYQKTFPIHSLHIMGEADKVIPKDLSELLTTNFQDPEIICHPGGHYIPSNSEFKTKYVTFLKDMKSQVFDESSHSNI